MDTVDTQIKLCAQDAPLLIEAGFVAIKQVDEDNARKCFHASMILDPEQSLPVVGLGIIALYKLDLEEAIRLFEMVLRKEPANDMAQTMLGIAHLYTLSDKSVKEGEHIIEEALKNTKEEAVAKLAKDSLVLKKEIKQKMKDLHPLEANKKMDPIKRLKGR